jgi:hypothetical protein
MRRGDIAKRRVLAWALVYMDDSIRDGESVRATAHGALQRVEIESGHKLRADYERLCKQAG